MGEKEVDRIPAYQTDKTTFDAGQKPVEPGAVNHRTKQDPGDNGKQIDVQRLLCEHNHKEKDGGNDKCKIDEYAPALDACFIVGEYVVNQSSTDHTGKSPEERKADGPQSIPTRNHGTMGENQSETQYVDGREQDVNRQFFIVLQHAVHQKTGDEHNAQEPGPMQDMFRHHPRSNLFRKGEAIGELGVFFQEGVEIGEGCKSPEAEYAGKQETEQEGKIESLDTIPCIKNRRSRFPGKTHHQEIAANGEEQVDGKIPVMQGGYKRCMIYDDGNHHQAFYPVYRVVSR